MRCILLSIFLVNGIYGVVDGSNSNSSIEWSTDNTKANKYKPYLKKYISLYRLLNDEIRKLKKIKQRLPEQEKLLQELRKKREEAHKKILHPKKLKYRIVKKKKRLK